MKKNYFILATLGIMFCSFAIEKPNYQALTERDRVLIAVSYYEVGQLYIKENKKELGEAHIAEAKAIEKEVEKYVSGELIIPPKKIEFDWDSIFAEVDEAKEAEQENDNKNISDDEEISLQKSIEREETSTVDSTIHIEESEDQNKDEEEISSSVENSQDLEKRFHSLMTFLQLNEFESAINIFDETIYIEELDIYLTREELEETIKGWLEENETLPSYSILSAENATLVVKFDAEFFFFPLKDQVLVLHWENKNDLACVTAVSVIKD